MAESSTPRIHMIWSTPIDNRPASGRVKVALCIRETARAIGEVRESDLASASKGNFARWMRSAAAWSISLVRGSPMPLQCALFADPTAIYKVIEGIQDGDFVYLDGVRTLPLLRRLRARFPSIHVVVDLDDLMSRRLALLRAIHEPLSLGYLTDRVPMRLRRFIEGPASRMITAYEHWALQSAEVNVMALADAVVLLSEADLVQLPLGRALGMSILPPAPAIRVLRRLETPLRFVFVGTDALTQNRLTIDYLVKLWAKYAFPTELVIYGVQLRSIPEVPGVRFAGYVDTLDEIFDACSILLTPTLLGGGIKTKVLDAFAYSVPVVGNPLTFEGMPITGHPLILSDETDLIDLIRDPESRRADLNAAGKSGWNYVHEQHSRAVFDAAWRHALLNESEVTEKLP